MQFTFLKEFKGNFVMKQRIETLVVTTLHKLRNPTIAFPLKNNRFTTSSCKRKGRHAPASTYQSPLEAILALTVSG